VKKLALGMACLILCGCQSGGGGVVDKVMYDFGLGEKPEGYESISDRVMDRLQKVGETELKRLNREGRHGEVLFQDLGGLKGKYYKESKIYESFYPLEANAASRGGVEDRGYVGFIEYSYRVYQGERKGSRTEAGAEAATIGTDERGREVYRYRFSSGGAWDGAKGEKTRR
jgi:hypothetical protein